MQKSPALHYKGFDVTSFKNVLGAREASISSVQDGFEVQLNQNEPQLSLFDQDAVTAIDDNSSNRLHTEDVAYRSYAANDSGGGYFVNYGPEAQMPMLIQSKSTANHHQYKSN